MSPPPDGIPDELAKSTAYVDVRALDKGGMGVVYLAKNKLMDRTEVLKVISDSLVDNAAGRKRFLREIQAAAQLLHPNIVVAYAAQEIGRLLVMAMEYVPGENLKALVERAGPLSVRRACTFAAQVAAGLQHAHERGLVHRDIKPANVICTTQHKKTFVKIVDFGLAKLGLDRLPDSHLTVTGTSLGTPLFMAPEQALDATAADARADLYSLGATLYFLLSGRPPIIGNNYNDLIVKLATREPDAPIATLRSDVPPGLAAAIDRLLRKDPADRYQTAADVAQALLPFAKQKTADDGAPLPEYPRTQDDIQVPPAAPPLPVAVPIARRLPDGPNDSAATPPVVARRPVAVAKRATPVIDLLETREPESTAVTATAAPAVAAAGRKPRRVGWAFKAAALVATVALGLYAAAVQVPKYLNRDGQRIDAEMAEYKQQKTFKGRMAFLESRAPARLAAWRAAADGGNPRAMFFLARCLAEGVAVPKDPEAGVAWFRKAADRGDPLAMNNLGYYVGKGIGVPAKDPVEAVSWFRKAAELGEPMAMNNLGYHLGEGTGVPAKDPAAALMWCRKAVELGDPMAMNNLGNYLENGLGVPAKDPEGAVSWYRKAAEIGEPIAMRNLGRCYFTGVGLPAKDLSEAVTWFRKAAEGDDLIAMKNLGYCHETGQGVPATDPAQAFSWYLKAAEGGNLPAMVSVGRCYQLGLGVPGKDPEQGVAWFRKAADVGSAEAMVSLGACYYTGTGVPASDPAQSVAWFRKAADLGSADAMRRLATCYKDGIGVTADPVEADRWTNKAIDAEKRLSP